MSGHTGDESAHQGLVANGAAFLPKPFSLASLTEKVQAVLDE
jgi:DNA-binding response OmpR family regulator